MFDMTNGNDYLEKKEFFTTSLMKLYCIMCDGY